MRFFASKELTENAKLNQQLKQLNDEEAYLSEATDNPNFERIARGKSGDAPYPRRIEGA